MGGAVHRPVAKKFTLMCSKKFTFYQRSRIILSRYGKKFLKILSQRVEIRAYFSFKMRVFQWEAYLVVCHLLKPCIGHVSFVKMPLLSI